MSTQPGQHASTLGQPIPRPTFASVRVEFADGTFREFHVHKPLQADVTIPLPHFPHDLNGDLGVIPPGVVPPGLPRVDVSIKAGITPEGQVITVDSRAEGPQALTRRMLALLDEALALRKTEAGDDPWRGWERKARALLRGEPR